MPVGVLLGVAHVEHRDLSVVADLREVGKLLAFLKEPDPPVSSRVEVQIGIAGDPRQVDPRKRQPEEQRHPEGHAGTGSARSQWAR